MTVVNATFEGVNGFSDDSVVLFRSPRLRGSGDSEVIVTRKSIRVKPEDGEISVDLDPGLVEVAISGGSYLISVPTSGPVNLWDLIAAAIPFPDGTPSEAVGAAVSAHMKLYPGEVALSAVGSAVDELVPPAVETEVQTVTPGIAADYWSSQAPGVVPGDTPGTVRQTFGGMESEEFPAAVGLWEGIANKPVIEFAEHGFCDGVTDDRANLASVLSTLSSAGGGVLRLPPTDIAFTMNAFPRTVDFPANVTVTGTPGQTRILLSSDNNSEYRGFAGTSGDNVTITGVTFVRDTNCTGVLFTPGGYDGFHVRDCVIDGQKTLYANIFHGWFLNDGVLNKNITIRDCLVTELDYGLLQNNGNESNSDTLVVDNCTFYRNYADDLAFNAPDATQSNVVVTNSRFIDNQSETNTGGYGVSFAHTVNATVRDCYFENYYNEAIHAENNSRHLTFVGNTIVHCGTHPGNTLDDVDRGGIVVTFGCEDVLISGNTLDHTLNENSLHAIVVKNLTGDTAPGGHPLTNPRRVTIDGNIIRCGASYQGMRLVMVEDLIVRGNTIIGDGGVVSGVWDEGNNGYGIKVIASTGSDTGSTVIEGNIISGMRYGIAPPFDTDGLHEDYLLPTFEGRRALGNPGNVVGNVIRQCKFGILAVPSGVLNIANNTLMHCVRPLLVGENQYTAEVCSVVGNSAMGCSYPIEVDGLYYVIRAGGDTVTTGAGKTVGVVETFVKMPVGTVIKFSGGGTLTLEEAVTQAHPFEGGSPVNLVGTVAGASISDTEYGVVAGLPHSTTPANNYFSLSNNTDTAAWRWPGKTPELTPDDLTVGESVFPRSEMLSNAVAVSGGITFFTFFTAKKTEPITKVRTRTGATPAVTPTLCRIGIYSVAADGALTLVASTANDTSLFTAAYTSYEKALSSTFEKVAGQRYAVGLLVVGSDPSFQGRLGVSDDAGIAPMLSAYKLSTTDLWAGGGADQLVGVGTAIYHALLP